MKLLKDGNTYKAILGEPTRRYYKRLAEYTTANTYTFNITQPGNYIISLVGGGGGAGQVDGYGDPYDDTAWSWHYGHNGADGGQFKGVATLGTGTLKIVVGAGGGPNAGGGGDSYATFTPTGGSAVEIARARGGHSGYPDGNIFWTDVPGGTVTYNSTYITYVMINKTGNNGGPTWQIHI